MFMKAALEVLDQHGIEPTAIHQWTDGCAGQYKGKNAFHDISKTTLPFQRNFFTTSHGKNVCDGLGAVVKNMAMRHVMGHKIIANAEDMFQFCCSIVAQEAKVMTKPGQEPYISIRQFVYVDASTVQRDRPEVRTFTGTWKLHAVQATGTSLELRTRNLSCYCPSCVTGNWQNCVNKEYVGPWETKQIQLVAKKFSFF